jgi:hypothetical protein
MNDILFFGAGYNGDKRDIDGTPLSIKYTAKPVIFSVATGEQATRPHYTGFHDFQVLRHIYRDKSYLIAVFGGVPSNDTINYSIELERVNPID